MRIKSHSYCFFVFFAPYCVRQMVLSTGPCLDPYGARANGSRLGELALARSSSNRIAYRHERRQRQPRIAQACPEALQRWWMKKKMF